MLSKYLFMRFPLWQFLKQPVFDQHYKTVFSPRLFWHIYQIQLFERCLRIDCAAKDVRRDG